MTNSMANPMTNPIAGDIHKATTWSIVLSVLMIAAGVLAIISPAIAGVAVTVVLFHHRIDVPKPREPMQRSKVWLGADDA